MKDTVLNLLQEILLCHPHGIKEYELLEALAEKGMPLLDSGGSSDTLELFRSHFTLFHFLYLLRQRLRNRQMGDLEIHCLGICIKPFFAGSNTQTPCNFDHLEQYYLNFDNCTEVDQNEVDNMITQFWQRYISYDGREEGLSVLGLIDPVTNREIKKRYRELARLHHPDTGGDAEKFKKIQRAASILLG